MKAILIITLLIGAFLIGRSEMAHAQLLAVRYRITDSMRTLKNETNGGDVDRGVSLISRDFEHIHSWFRTMAWAGGILVCFSVAGLTIEVRRGRRTDRTQPPPGGD
jgi:hypothetical protein